MKILTTLFLASLHLSIYAQPKDGVAKMVDDINKLIDRGVVDRNISILQKHYADDFVFTHGTGTVDSKESWIKNIKQLSESNRFTSREHDSTIVELHDDIAILTGTLSVTRLSGSTVAKYALRYVRVFVLRDQHWQLISHRTTSEWHL